MWQYLPIKLSGCRTALEQLPRGARGSRTGIAFIGQQYNARAAAAPCRLGRIQLPIRRLQGSLSTIPPCRLGDGHPQADGDNRRNAGLRVNDSQGAHGAFQLLRNMASAGPMGIGQNADKLFPAIACNQIVRTHTVRAQDIGHGDQTQVALLVSVHVVVLFEEIDIDQDDCQGIARARAAPPLSAQDLIEMSAVGNTSQAIDKRKIAQSISA